MMPSVGDYMLVFTTGLLGGAHCVGMCGGFVLMYSAGLARVSGGPGGLGGIARGLAAHMAYNSGRVLTYSLVGGFMGYAGTLVETAARLKGIQGAALILAGTVMIAMGLKMLGLVRMPGTGPEDVGASMTGDFGRMVRSLVMRRGIAPVFVLGLALGLIPCGLSYSMEVRAAATGGFVQGFTLMFAFGLGTVPALVGAGFFYNVIGVNVRLWVYRAAAVIILVIGAKALLRGLAYNGWIAHGIFW